MDDWDSNWRQRIAKEVEKIKSMEKTVRREYIWGYYKYHIIGSIVAVILIGSFINDTIINPPPQPILTIAWMAGFEFDEQFDALEDALYPAMVTNPRRETVSVIPFTLTGDPSFDMAMFQRFGAMTAAASLDIIIGYPTDYEGGIGGLGMAPGFMFLDLHPILDRAGVSADGLLYYQDDEEMPEEIAFAFPIAESSLFYELGFHTTANRYLGVVANTPNIYSVEATLRLLLQP